MQIFKRLFTEATKASVKIAPKNPLLKISPKPLALPAAEQKEFARLVKEHSANNAVNPDYVAKNAAFEGNTNPKTGEVGGPKGLEPTRFGDWERGGRAFDF